MPEKSPKTPSAVKVALRVLRERILALDAGAYLGSEDDLLALLGISRPTFRQAARLLEHEQLLQIRRGVGGGFYSCRPSLDTVAHAASLILQLEHATMQHIIDASLPLNREMVRLAACCGDAALRARLQQWVAREAALDEISLDAFFKSELECVQILADMCGNPAVRLFNAILYDFGLRQTGVRIFRHFPGRVLERRRARLQLVASVLAGDEELAMLMWRRAEQLLSGWIREEMGEQGAQSAFTQPPRDLAP